MRSSILAELPDDDRRRVLAAARRRTFVRNEILFREDDLADTFHLLSRGHVAIRTSTRLGDVATLTILGPGESFGELALLDSSHRRTATAAAIDAVETLSLQRPVFDELRHAFPSVDRLLVLAMAARIRDLSDQLRDAYFAATELRVLRRLVALSATFGHDGGTVDIPVTQETLASVAGTTRSTVNRVLREAERGGLLELARGRIVVTDPAGLAAQAGA